VHSSIGKTALRKIKLVYETALGQLYLNLGHDYGDAVLLAGSGRGGTTWIAELINFDNSYRLIFEPLRASQFKAFHGRRYFRPEDDHPELAALLGTVFNGRLRSLLSDRYNRQLLPRKRLVKEIILNLSLGWVHRQFPQIPIIWLVRHPCAVVSSRLRLGWNYSLRTFLRQESLMSDWLAPFKSDMEKASSPFDIHLYHWCIETFVPFKQLTQNEVHLVFYEDFCTQSRRELVRLFTFLGKTPNKHVFSRLERPSSQTLRRLPTRTALLNGWRERFTKSELDRLYGVLNQFGLGSLYSESGEANSADALSLFSRQKEPSASLR
jgi:Sulfotransferase domain